MSAAATWDLNQNTAAALGFDGVGTVWATQLIGPHRA